MGVRLSLSRDPSLDSLAARSAPLPRLALLGSRRSASRGRGWRFEADRSATANAAAVIDAATYAEREVVERCGVRGNESNSVPCPP